MHIGHKKLDGSIQQLSEHLSNVMQEAGIFGRTFDAEVHARRTGLLHDAGKYSHACQRRITDPENASKVDHSTAGAQIALKEYKDGWAALAIAGHHGGMPDFGGKFASEGDGTLRGRCRKDLSGEMDYSQFWEENAPDPLASPPQWLMKKTKPFANQFYVRILFSCLVDADFLDTERFMRGEMPRSGYSHMSVLLTKLMQHVQPWLDNPKSEINQKRSEILHDCLKAGNGKRGLYTLTVPTGGGKTVSSLAFALTHAVKHGIQHVIYVIPYTSIIEQNATIFKSILGDDDVIEHHSGVEYDVGEDIEDATAMRHMLATENWDAPIIVTTAVQFFESLFSNKPSRCRKLHSIANSVVIFDEAQMLPVSCLKPCVSTIAELVSHYGITAVLCTATQPALNRYFNEYNNKLDIREICEKADALQLFFRRVHFERKTHMGVAELSKALMLCRQVLCVVNTRKNAQDVFSLLPEKGSYHLSTRMTPDHRSWVLDEIRARLRAGEECRVVSTSLIEAGVDVDFPEVWREMAGLDSILQAAGRCNREGWRSPDESKVVIFTMEGGVPKGMQPNAAAAEVAMEGAEHIDDSATVRRFFEQLYWQKGDQALDEKGIMDLCQMPNMKSIAERFHMIDSDTRTIYVPTDENASDLEQLRQGKVSRQLMRRLGRSSVSVYARDWDTLEEAGMLEKITESCAILKDLSVYDNRCGLIVEAQPRKGLQH